MPGSRRRAGDDLTKAAAGSSDGGGYGGRPRRHRQIARDRASFAVDKTELTKTLADDLAALRRYNALLVRQMKGGHKTLELEREQLSDPASDPGHPPPAGRRAQETAGAEEADGPGQGPLPEDGYAASSFVPALTAAEAAS